MRRIRLPPAQRSSRRPNDGIMPRRSSAGRHGNPRPHRTAARAFAARESHRTCRRRDPVCTGIPRWGGPSRHGGTRTDSATASRSGRTEDDWGSSSRWMTRDYCNLCALHQRHASRGFVRMTWVEPRVQKSRSVARAAASVCSVECCPNYSLRSAYTHGKNAVKHVDSPRGQDGRHAARRRFE